MSISIILIGVTCLISYLAFEDRKLKDKLLMHPQSVHEFGQFYRFVSSGFVHANWSHLGINMFVLYMFGRMVENGILLDSNNTIVSFTHIFGEGMGRINFLVLYIGAIIAGSIPSFIKHQENGYYRALGASGGTSGIVFAVIIFDPWAWLLFPPVPFIVFGVGYLFYSSYMSKNGNDNIGHDAHFWGAVYGFVITFAMISAFSPALLDGIFQSFLAGPSMP